MGEVKFSSNYLKISTIPSVGSHVMRFAYFYSTSAAKYVGVSSTLTAHTPRKMGLLYDTDLTNSCLTHTYNFVDYSTEISTLALTPSNIGTNPTVSFITTYPLTTATMTI